MPIKLEIKIEALIEDDNDSSESTSDSKVAQANAIPCKSVPSNVDLLRSRAYSIKMAFPRWAGLEPNLVSRPATINASTHHARIVSI